MKLAILKKPLLLLAITVFAASCNQDPIFHTIFREVKPLEARIKGTPTAMAVFSRASGTALYVASGKEIYWYVNTNNTDPKKCWDGDRGRVPKQPGGTITSLAATDEYLYALCMADPNTRAMSLNRIGKSDNSWSPVGFGSDAASHPVLQSIYSAGNLLFIASASDSDKDKAPSYAVLYVSDTDTQIKSLGKDLYYLNGAAFDGDDHYYLSANDMINSVGGIYGIPKTSFAGTPSLTTLTNSDSSSTNESPVFRGIISLEDSGAARPGTVLAMDRSGALYSVGSGKFTYLNKMTSIDSMKFTGALALWSDKNASEWTTPGATPKPAWLLAGIASMDTSITTGYSNGYREFDLLRGNYSDSSFYQPGDAPGSTVHDHERYLATLDKYCINSIFQAPKTLDPEMTLFASTQLNGLWSYRLRDGEWQWNAEE
jgi:hypothetical protein